MIVFDTEDDSAEVLASGKSGFTKRVTQIAAICENGKRFHNTGDASEFVRWCHAQGPKHRDLWAFNAMYDIGNLCNNGEYRLDDFDVTMVKGRFIKGTLKNLIFFDVRNLSGAGSSVGTLGLAVRLPKFGYKYSEKDLKKFPAREVAKWKKFAKIPKAKLFRNLEYVFRDCEIPLRWMQFMREQCQALGLEKVPATLGSLCTKAFDALGFDNWHECSDESQSALRGARVELFNQGGTGRIAYTDINSLYPFCMTQKFPTCLGKLDSLDGYGICKCSVDVPKNEFVAPLPWRDEEKRLLFPVGKFSGVWTIHELKNAMNHGTKVTDIKWILGSKDGVAYYREYILQMFANRLVCKSDAESLFWKLLMNNLYGRTAISGIISRSLNLTEENCQMENSIPYGRKILADHSMPLPKFTNYLHAAYVLSYARIHLYGFLKQIPKADLIYCDTDSTIFFCQDKLPFPVGKELGMMKLESMGSRCIPYLPKTYVFDAIYKAKGVPKALAKSFIETGGAEYDLPFKLRESIRFYEDNNSRKLSVWRTVEKLRHSEYDKKRKSGEFYLPKLLNQA